MRRITISTQHIMNEASSAIINNDHEWYQIAYDPEVAPIPSAWVRRGSDGRDSPSSAAPLPRRARSRRISEPRIHCRLVIIIEWWSYWVKEWCKDDHNGKWCSSLTHSLTHSPSCLLPLQPILMAVCSIRAYLISRSLLQIQYCNNASNSTAQHTQVV